MPRRIKKPKLRVGELLERYRSRAGLNYRSELCELLERKGCNYSLSTINKYHSGERPPSARYIADIAYCLELSEYERDALINFTLSAIVKKFQTDCDNRMVKLLKRRQ